MAVLVRRTRRHGDRRRDGRPPGRRRRRDPLAGRALHQPPDPRPAAADTARCARAPRPRGRRVRGTGGPSVVDAGGRPQCDRLAACGLGEAVLRANRAGADRAAATCPARKGLPAAGRQSSTRRSPRAARSPTCRPATSTRRHTDRSTTTPQPGRPPTLASSGRCPSARPDRALLVVCEGTADALVAAQSGFCSVGVFGAAYPDDGLPPASPPPAPARQPCRHPGRRVLRCRPGGPDRCRPPRRSPPGRYIPAVIRDPTGRVGRDLVGHHRPCLVRGAHPADDPFSRWDHDAAEADGGRSGARVGAGWDSFP